ncbi:MAG: hypothetical protein ABW032_12560 [Burkholderiaceae bacterium]
MAAAPAPSAWPTWPLPTNVPTTPAGVILRITLATESATKMLPAGSTAMPPVWANVAVAAGPSTYGAA